MSTPARKPAAVCVRDRLLDTADRLFYAEGIQSVGIDRVLSEAGAAKASLYSHFGSKDELIAAYTERRCVMSQDMILSFVADAPPADRARRFFDFLVEWVESPEFNGCPMRHVAVELHDESHPARVLVTAHRAWVSERITEWVRDAGVDDVPRVAGALYVLFEGAVAASELDGSGRAHDARWLARRLLAQ